MLTISGSARWEGFINRGYPARAAQTGVGASERDIADAHIVSTLVTPERFPYGLTRWLDGVEQRIAAVMANPAAEQS